MNYLSVCSGIEAATCAWHPLGWTPAAFSEIEPFPSAVLAHHYPSTQNLGDMTKFKDWNIDAIDLLVGGTPCQSFSVAGLRKGLADPRGNLMLTFGAIAAKYRPQWLVWENVPGVLSSNEGRDFASFLGLITGQEVQVPAGGWQNSGIVAGIPEAYGAAYRVLDAQYFGVAQRRRRVFVVANLGDWRSAAAVLFERHSVSGHPAPRREAGQAVAPTIRAGAANGGAGHGARSGDSKDELIVPVAGTLCIATGQAGAEIGADMAPTLNCNHEAPYAVYQTAHTLRGEGFDASEDGTGRGTPLVPVAAAFKGGQGSSAGGIGYDEHISPTLSSADSGSNRTPVVMTNILAFDTPQVTSATNRSNPKAGDPCHPLAAGMHAPAIAFDCKASGQNGFGVGEIASTMRSMGHSNSHQNGGGHQAVMSSMRVRRLTPGECEKLQGFKPGYTAIQVRGKAAADGPRYKALGNSMAVPCMAWIGRRIQMVEEIA